MCGSGAGGTTGTPEQTGTDDDNKYFPPSPFPPYEPIEKIEVESGKLTITGLDAYEEGTDVFAGHEKFNSIYVTERYDIAAYGKTYNFYDPNKKKTTPGLIEHATVKEGKVTLNVYKRTASYSLFYKYNSTETVKLEVRIKTMNANYEIRYDVHGVVTVNFFNGVGEGEFVPN